MTTDIHLFLDLSGGVENWSEAQAIIDSLASSDGPGAIMTDATCLLPASIPAPTEGYAGWRFLSGENPISACNLALERAGAFGRPLLVLLGPVRSGNEAAGVLLNCLEMDPMFGFALPRQADSAGRIRKLVADFGDPEVKTIPRRALCELPGTYIFPEFLTPCFLVRRELTMNLGSLHDGFETLAGAWLHFMCRARRIGFRCVVSNRAVVTELKETDDSMAAPAKSDFWKLHSMYPDVTTAREQISRIPAHGHESLLARALSEDDGLRKTLLIDARGVQPGFNGTTHCAFGIMDGLTECHSGWRLAALVKPQANAFHRLTQRYPSWDILEDCGDRRFTAALRLSQPWDIQTMIDLHRVALFNFYLVLDSISWDTLYNCGSLLDGTWRFLAQQADGLLYISAFTGDRFRARFPLAPGVREFVSYLAFHPLDYRRELAAGGTEEPSYILIVGNHLDHKAVPDTTELLTSAFPFQKFNVLGSRQFQSHQVVALPSGHIPEEQIEQLYARARVIVFPSYYEGFGLPILRGLSYGRSVVARRSALLEEVLARYRGDGRAFSYERPAELVEIVARLLHGLPVEPMPLGGALAEGQEPMRWKDVAGGMLDFIERSVANVHPPQWLKRQATIEQLLPPQA